MKITRLLLACLLLLSFAACNTSNNTPDHSANGADGQTDTSSKKIPTPQDVGVQIPAAEVLGTTIERQLRYQPADEVAEYLENVNDLDLYLAAMSSAIREKIGKLEPETPTFGTIVVGVNAKAERRIWFEFPETIISEKLKATLTQAVESVQQPVVKKELVVVGIAISLWGYKESPAQTQQVLLPKAWKEAGKQFKEPQKATKLAQLSWGKPVS